MNENENKLRGSTVSFRNGAPSAQKPMMKLDEGYTSILPVEHIDER